MRTVFLILTASAGYFLLRGWPGDWHPIIRISLAGTSLLAAVLLWGRPEKSRTKAAKPNRPPARLDLAGVVLGLILIEFLILALLSFVPEKSEELALIIEEAFVDEFETEVTNPATVETVSTGSDSGAVATSNWLFSGPGPRPLRRNRSVRPSNRPEVYLYPASGKDRQSLMKTDRFLRNFTLAEYREGVWHPDRVVPRTLEAVNGAITRPTITPGAPISYDILHQANPRSQTLAITLPNFTSLAQPSLRETAPATFRLPRSTAKRGNYRYSVTSVPFTFDQVTEVIPDLSVDPVYLALPGEPSLRTKILKLASRFGPPGKESLLALRQHLQATCQYSLEVDFSPAIDPLTAFLFEENKGYCSHFASATVLLARAMGIPARMAFGWSGGRFYETPGFFVFRAKEAHAWAEIHLEGLGWVIFETTPASREEGRASTADDDEDAPLPDDHLAADDETSESPALPLLRLSLWVTGATAIGLAVIFLLRKREHPVTPATVGPNFLPDPPNYLAAFRRACQVAGFPMPPGRTLRAHLSGMNGPDFAEELLSYHYAVQYSDHERDKPTEKKLLARIRRWEKSFLSSRES